jgi:hypothetical protein
MHEVETSPGEDQDGELMWIRPQWSKLQFELRAGDSGVATLDWIRGSRALARWGESQYHFSRQGWLRPRIVVHKAPSEVPDEPLATLSYRSGSLTFAGGQTFTWKKPRWFTRVRVWVDSAGNELVRFRPARRSLVAVTAQPEALRQPELPLLILLGQYLIVLAKRDAEAAGAAASTAVVASN